jgi:hypothetical protein
LFSKKEEKTKKKKEKRGNNCRTVLWPAVLYGKCIAYHWLTFFNTPSNYKVCGDLEFETGKKKHRVWKERKVFWGNGAISDSVQKEEHALVSSLNFCFFLFLFFVFVLVFVVSRRLRLVATDCFNSVQRRTS